MPSIADHPTIAAVRHFNRFYTRLIGTLDEGLLQSPLSLAEARVLYEIANRTQPTASSIAVDLGLDMGYLSRILRSFTASKLINRRSSPNDRRQTLLSLTAAGRRQFNELNQRSATQVHQLLAPLTPAQHHSLVNAMASIEGLLNPQAQPPLPFILRSHRPGDMGWIIERHSILYSTEYGWDVRFEALVARIAADFIDNFDADRERCWIADRNGERLGCVLLVQDKEKAPKAKPVATARLRLLLVEPSARGLGLGRTLVQQCTSFARSVGYKRIVLWTNSVLYAARHIYKQEGYRLVSEKPHTSFGKSLVGQTWQLDL